MVFNRNSERLFDALTSGQSEPVMPRRSSTTDLLAEKRIQAAAKRASFQSLSAFLSKQDSGMYLSPSRVLGSTSNKSGIARRNSMSALHGAPPATAPKWDLDDVDVFGDMAATTVSDDELFKSRQPSAESSVGASEPDSSMKPAPETPAKTPRTARVPRSARVGPGAVSTLVIDGHRHHKMFIVPMKEGHSSRPLDDIKSEYHSTQNPLDDAPAWVIPSREFHSAKKISIAVRFQNCLSEQQLHMNIKGARNCYAAGERLPATLANREAHRTCCGVPYTNKVMKVQWTRLGDNVLVIPPRVDCAKL